jgi:hypothetical protein
MTDTTKTTSSFPCKGRDCPEIQRLEGRIDKIYVKLDSIIVGIFTVLVTIIGSLLL